MFDSPRFLGLFHTGGLSQQPEVVGPASFFIIVRTIQRSNAGHNVRRGGTLAFSVGLRSLTHPARTASPRCYAIVGNDHDAARKEYFGILTCIVGKVR
jgi:hypothetical protein